MFSRNTSQQLDDDRTRPALRNSTDLAASAALVFLVIFVSCLFGILTRPVGQLAAFWPANAILLGMLLRLRRPVTAWHWLAAALAYVLADALTGAALNFNLLLNLANLVSAATAFLLFRLFGREDLRLERPTSVLRMAAIVGAGSAACGLVGAAVYPLLFGGSPAEGWKFWFATELVNYMAILPIILTWPDRLPRLPALRTPSVAATATRRTLPFIALCLSCVAGHLIGGPGAVTYPVPALLWCALDYNLFAAALLAFAYCIWALASISTGALIIAPNLDNWDVLMSLRLGITLIALGPLIVASVSFARRQLLEQLRRIATIDSLTGILNRRAFVEMADTLLASATPASATAALLMLDIDHFKAVNDSFGHAAGDRALAAFAALATRLLPPGAVFGRIGGEEFAVLLGDTDRIEAEAIAERLRAACAVERIVLDASRTIPITTSIGIAIAHGPVGLGTLLGTADTALYRAKANGRNRVETETVLPGAAPFVARRSAA